MKNLISLARCCNEQQTASLQPPVRPPQGQRLCLLPPSNSSQGATPSLQPDCSLTYEVGIKGASRLLVWKLKASHLSASSLLPCLVPASMLSFSLLTIGPCDLQGSPQKGTVLKAQATLTIRLRLSGPAQGQRFCFLLGVTWSKQLLPR